MRHLTTVLEPVAHRTPIYVVAAALLAMLLLVGCASQPAGMTQPAAPIVALAETPTTALETAATAEPTATATATSVPTNTPTTEPSATPSPTTTSTPIHPPEALPVPVVLTTPVTPQATASRNVNLRSGPGTNFDVVGGL